MRQRTSIKTIIKKSFNKLGYDITRMELDAEEEKKLIQLSDIRKVHYGCGRNLLDGWVNLDINPANYLKKDIVYYESDLTKRHPFADSSIEFGFAEDFIEHLSQVDAIIFLTEIYRTFKKRGVLRISTPDLNGALTDNYCEISYDQARNFKINAYTKHSHKHFFCFEELEQVCHYIGFDKIQLVEYGKSSYPELMNLDSRIRQIGVNMMVEIVK